jgi:hypothetical protein
VRNGFAAVRRGEALCSLEEEQGNFGEGHLLVPRPSPRFFLLSL